MRVGVSPWGSSLAGVLRVASAAVEAGVDTLWLGDGLLVVPDFPQWCGGMEPLTELAWLAGRYPSVAVGIGAAVLPLRDVLWVAKQAATLDQLTQGRFFLVVTPGIWEREFVYRGLSYQAWVSGLTTSSMLCRRLLWGGGTGATLSSFPRWAACRRSHLRREGLQYGSLVTGRRSSGH